MEYRKIKEFEGYEVSEYGDVISFKGNVPIKLTPRLDRYGYLVINLYSNGKMKTVKVHRLVCTAFCTGEGDTVNHKDFNKLNNHYFNLEFCSSKDNIKHAWNNGVVRPPKGMSHYRFRITEEIKLQIIDMKNKGIPNHTIANIFGIHPNSIYKYYSP